MAVVLLAEQRGAIRTKGAVGVCRCTCLVLAGGAKGNCTACQ
jgi:hypothetical protein